MGESAMYRYSADIKGSTPYLFGKYVSTERASNQTHDDHERSTWPERAHQDENGDLFVPSRAAKNMMLDVAKYLGERIKGQGKKTYTAKFEAGLRYDGINIPMFNLDGDKRVNITDVEPLWAFVPSDGKVGGGSRVWKAFPKVNSWSLSLRFLVVDEILDPDLLTKYLSSAGMFKGIGMWRPGRNGDYGTFFVDDQSIRTEEL